MSKRKRLVKTDAAVAAAAEAVGATLEETAKGPLSTINRAIQVAGMEQVAAVAEKAKEAHAAGMLVKDGSRARTLGGCFFYELRKSLTCAQTQQVFPWRPPAEESE